MQHLSDSAGGEGAEDMQLQGGPAGDGEAQVVLMTCWTNLSGHSWRLAGSKPRVLSPLCSLCILRKERSGLRTFGSRRWIHSRTVSHEKDKY